MDLRVPVRFVDFEHVQVPVGEDFIARMGAREGEFRGIAQIAVQSAVDQALYTSDELQVTLQLRTTLSPSLESVDDTSLIFVNDRLEIAGQDMLLGGGEGFTTAVIDGCFSRELEGGGFGACSTLATEEVPIRPASPFEPHPRHLRLCPRDCRYSSWQVRGHGQPAQSPLG